MASRVHSDRRAVEHVRTFLIWQLPHLAGRRGSCLVSVRGTPSLFGRCADVASLAGLPGAEVLRKLAGKTESDPLVCADVLPFGQSLRYSWVTLVAEYCPISM